MSEPVDVTNLEPGTVLLNKYRIVETLGIGGMGVVVAADHVSLRRRVALKFLLPKLVDKPAVAERFMREARAAIRIDSDHVCKVIDVDSLPEGIPFMVMEYLEGEDLALLVDAERRFAIDEAIGLVVQAAEALAQAHRVGIVHRDIKPANLFLVERGQEPPLVKVLDFGISKVMEDGDWSEQAALTKTTTVLGSGLYMSPEQMRSAKNVDRRTDIYALGICLYELLAHTQPYTADSFAELCVKVSTEPPDPLRRHRPDVSEELAAIIARAYAAKPDERYQSVAEFVEALAPYAPESAQPTIAAIAGIVDGQRRTSPSLAPPPVGPTAAGAAPPPAAPRSTTAEASALAATAEQRPAPPRRIGLVVAGAAVLLTAAVVVVAMTTLGGESTPSTAVASEVSEAGATSASPTTGPSEAPSASAEPTSSPAAGAEAGNGGAATGPTVEPDASGSVAPAASTPPPRPVARPRPSAPPGVIREGDFCFRINPQTKVRELVSCP